MRMSDLLGLLATFFCLPIVGMAQTASPAAGATGIEGVIMISPIHGGPVRQGAADSKPLPNTAFVVEADNHSVASFTTDDQGRFRIALPAGHYRVVGKDRPGIGRFGPFEVDVTDGAVKSVQWTCDSGMR